MEYHFYVFYDVEIKASYISVDLVTMFFFTYSGDALSRETICCSLFHCANKSAIHELATMLATSKNVLFQGPSHLLTTGADDVTL